MGGHSAAHSQIGANESNLTITFVLFADFISNEPLKVTHSCPGMCLSVYKKI